MAIVPKPWIKRPNMTVMKYFPNFPITSASDSISRIFALMRKKTPIGESLTNHEKRELNEWRVLKILPNNPTCNNHHGLAQRHEKILNWLSTLSHFSNCCTENDAKHDQTQDIHSFTPLSFDLEWCQWDYRDFVCACVCGRGWKNLR